MHHGNGVFTKHVEQLLLSVGIPFHRSMVIQMVSRQIREHRPLKCDTLNTMLVECVRAHFHADRIHAGMLHGNDDVAQGTGMGRCVLRGKDGSAVPDAGRSDEAYVMSGRREDLLQQRRTRRLPVRTCHTEKPNASGRIVQDGMRQDGKGVSRVADADVGNRAKDHVQRFIWALTNDDHGSGMQCRCDMLMGIHVRAVDGHKDESRLYEPRIIGYIDDVEVRDAVDNGIRQ